MERAVRLRLNDGELVGRALDMQRRAALRHGQQTAVVGRGVPDTRFIPTKPP